MKSAFCLMLVALAILSSPASFAQKHSSNGETSISAVTRFPYQDTTRTITEAVPVVLSGETVMFFWAESTVIRSARSTDGGVTWKSPGIITTARTTVMFLSGIRSATGRVILVWRDSMGVVETYSDDGLTWVTPRVIETTVTNLMLSQTVDGKLWLAYRWIFGGVVRLINSTDNGVSWSAPFSMPSFVKNQISLVSGSGTSIVGFFPSSAGKIEKVVSVNGGSTWSTSIPVLTSSGTEEAPRARRLSDGTIILLYQSSRTDSTPLPYATYDIIHVRSSDGGVTWSHPENFTRYRGNDKLLNIDLLNDKPLVIFNSDRFQPGFIKDSQLQSRLWYGIIGQTSDSLAPPVFLGCSVLPRIPNFPAIIRVYTDDEMGMLSVNVRYAFNGTMQTELPLFDDGFHNDLYAGDNVFGNELPPMPEGDMIFLCNMTDVTGQALLNIPAASFSIIRYEVPGGQGDSMKVAMNTSGIFGSYTFEGPGPRPINVGMQYPLGSPLEHLYGGGIWIGGKLDTTFSSSGVFSAVTTAFEGWAGPMREFFPGTATADTMWKVIGRNSPKPAMWDNYWGSSLPFQSAGDQNFFCTYSGYFVRPSSHIPMGVKVIQSSFTWNGATLPGIQILDYRIMNNSQRTIDSVYVAFFADADAGPMYSYMYSTRNYTEYFFASRTAIAHNPVDLGSTPMGVTILGSVPEAQRVTFKWYPGLQSPETDSARYILMSDGIVQPTGYPAVDDIRFLVSIGPFTLRPHTATSPDTLRVGFALLSAMNIDQLLSRANRAQEVYQRVIVRGEPIEPPVPPALPVQFCMSQNYPNPFNSSTKIEYQVPKTSHIELQVFDILGRQVATLVSGTKVPGVYEAMLDASEMSSGVYVYRLVADGFANSRKALLIK